MLFLLARCAAPVPDSPQACALYKVTDIPVSWSAGNTPLVDVDIEGHRLSFLFDTGAPSTVITRKAVDELGLRLYPSAHGTMTGIGGQSEVIAAAVRSFVVGGRDLGPKILFQLSFDLRDADGRADRAGVLGMSILSKYDIDLDLPNSRIALYVPRNCPSGKPPWDGGVQVHVEPDTSRRLYVQASLDGVTVPAILDTGASWTLVDRQVALQTGVSLAALAADPSNTGYGLAATPQRAVLHHFGRLTLGGLPVRPAYAYVLDLAGEKLALGVNVLHRHRIWLATLTHQVFIQPD